jgi:hypothetical protein
MKDTKIFKFGKWIQTHLLPDELYTKIIFRKLHGYRLNLDAPRTLNEKLHWMKLRGPKIIDPELVDKYLARKYIEKTVGKDCLIPIYGVYESVDEFIPPDDTFLPYIVKPTHDSGIGLIYRKRDAYSIFEARRILKERLSKNHYYSSKEYPYRYLKPRIIVEQLLEDGSGGLPNDYKFHFFSGHLEFIYCSIDRVGADLRQIFDPNWKRLDFSWNKSTDRFRREAPDLPSPTNLPEMVEIASKLAGKYPYIRVDLYSIRNKVYCGELTFFQGSGFDKITPYEKDLELGQKIDINQIKKIHRLVNK